VAAAATWRADHRWFSLWRLGRAGRRPYSTSHPSPNDGQQQHTHSSPDGRSRYSPLLPAKRRRRSSHLTTVRRLTCGPTPALAPADGASSVPPPPAHDGRRCRVRPRLPLLCPRRSQRRREGALCQCLSVETSAAASLQSSPVPVWTTTATSRCLMAKTPRQSRIPT
jgi:hypothetical protein